MKNLLAILLALACGGSAYADNLSDLRGWPANKTPCATWWNVDNFPLSLHVSTTQAGHRLVPALKQWAIQTTDAGIAKRIEMLDSQRPQLQWISDNNCPLILRDNNLAGDRIAEMSRRGTYPGATPVQWKLLDGVPNSTSVVDVLAAPEHWSQYATDYAATAFLRGLQERCPNPAWLCWHDNNEAGNQNPYAFSSWNSQTGVRTMKTPEQLGAISLSFRDHAPSIADPWEYLPEFYGKRAVQYQAFFTALRGGLVEWQGKPLYSVGYAADVGLKQNPPQRIIDATGIAPESPCYTGVGPRLYPGDAGTPANLLDDAYPAITARSIEAWQQAKARNPQAHRVIFVKAVGLLTAAEAGQHEVISPAIFGAWCESLLWQSRGDAIQLIYFTEAKDTPDKPVFSGNGLTRLEALGRSDLAALTEINYAIEAPAACDFVRRPEYARFWDDGVTIPATCSDPRVKVVAVKLGTQLLIYAWSPCALTGDVTISADGVEHVIPVPQPSSHTVIGDVPPPPNPVLRRMRVRIGGLEGERIIEVLEDLP